MTAFMTNPDQKLRLYEIATEMVRAGIAHEFITSAVELASEYEGAFELMELWAEETSFKEKLSTLVDLRNEIDEHLRMYVTPRSQARPASLHRRFRSRHG